MRGDIRNEIIWRRTLAKGLMTRRLPTNHDVLLAYQKGEIATWNSEAVFQPYDENLLDEKTDEKYSLRDKGGRRYQLTSLINPNPDRPNLTYEFLGVTRVWRWTKERMQEAYEQGLVIQSQAGRVPRLKRYLDEQRGRPLGDVWVDINPINARARERLGYPTQKPEALLERVIRASSNPGEVVLDPFCGCGTTIAVAERLRRHWIGIDISATAVEIMRRRLLKQHCAARIENAVEKLADLKALKPFEFQNWIINAIYGTHSPRKVGDMGIDGYWFFTRAPVQVKQSERVGRNVIDNFETAVRRARHENGYVIAFSFTKGAVEEAARAKKEEGLDIKLVKVAEIMLLVKRPHGKLGPQPGTVEELPLPAPRKPKDMPTAEELIESDTRAAG